MDTARGSNSPLTMAYRRYSKYGKKTFRKAFRGRGSRMPMKNKIMKSNMTYATYGSAIFNRLGLNARR